MSLYVLPDGDAIDLNTVTHVSAYPGETMADGFSIRPRVTLRTRFDLVTLNLATFEEACKVRDEIIKAVNARPLYVIHDAQSRYTHDEVL